MELLITIQGSVQGFQKYLRIDVVKFAKYRPKHSINSKLMSFPLVLYRTQTIAIKEIKVAIEPTMMPAKLNAAELSES